MGDKFQVMGALSKEEYEALKADIAETGVVVAVVEDTGGDVIDGHHRVRAWTELRDEGYDTPDYPREVRSDLKTNAEKRELAWRLNMQRRHLNKAQKQDMIARKLKESPDWSDNRVAKLLGVSWLTVNTVRLELEETSQIERLERLVGSDGKSRHRADQRTKEEREEFRKDWREVEEKRKTANLIETIHLNPDRTDKEIAERLESDEAEVAKYAALAKVEDVSPHDLRHRFGYEMAKRVPLHRLAQIMGPDSLDTTMVYVRGTQGDLQRAVEERAWA